MTHQERIKQLEIEIETFNYQRLKKQEEFQIFQRNNQQELSNINKAMFTRQGEIIGLKRLIEEENNDTNAT